ncbi:MAG TPA: 2-oxoacid:acceptor oxidoreductase family protein [Chloroflexota bacterium]|nr:2-oxoacid:acceptor oxidoreductase family protein [Chloroflexota bacterium]
MSKTVEVSLGGSGGQGLVLMGLILAEAAGIYEGHKVVSSQLYGPESRGGASRSDVIISDEEIDYPEVENPDILFVFNQAAADKYVSHLKQGGTMIYDSTFVTKLPEAKGKVFHLPITQLAREKVGRDIVANIVAIGAVVTITGIVSRDSLIQAVMDRVPKGTEEVNRKALQVGFDAAEALMSQANPA